MKQKSRLFFIASWLVLRLRWSLAMLRISANHLAWRHLRSKPGIIFFSRDHQRFPLDQWVFNHERSVYLYGAPSEESFRLLRLPDLSLN